ncbi:MAG: glycoside hydrolase family 3 protein [Cytophagaceae bacterium]
MSIRKYIVYFFILASCKVQQQTGNQQTNQTETVKQTEETKPSLAKGPALSREDSLDLKIGQMILVGINDRTSLSANDPLFKEFKSNKIGGICLFEKNIAKTNSKEAMKKLVADMQAASNIPLFITIDEEGGKVHRLKDKYGFIKVPSAAYLGNLNNADSTLYHGRKLAGLLAELGINMNFAPSIDLWINKNNPIIAKVERGYSADPETTTRHAGLFIQAHRENNVLTVLKHFPGHGSSADDTHLGMANVTDRWKIIELFPYKNLIREGNCDAIMTAHIVNCHLDTACLPSTLSKTVITGVLRNLLEYNGVVFSDDMQMHAISKHYGIESAVKLSILAGVDVVLFGNNVNANDRITATEIHNIIKKLVISGEIPEARINESYQRIIRLKEARLVKM